MGLLEMSVSGAVLILAVSIVRTAAVNNLPKNTFLVLWGIVLLRLLVPLRISSEISVYSWMPRGIKNIGVEAERQQKRDEAGDKMQTSRKDEDRSEKNPYEFYLSDKADDRKSDQDGSESDQKTLQDHILEVIWAAGCGICLLFFAFVYNRCRLSFAVSAAVRNDFCSDFVKKHSRRRLTQVRQLEFIKAPLTYGLIRPVILMPANTDWENKKQLKYVLMHECIHIRRYDTVTKVLLVIALSVHWFNPFVWMMYILCNRDLELSCDEMVIRAFGSSAKSEYARILISMEERKKQLTPLCNSFSKNPMEERIVAVMKMKERKISAVVAAAVLIFGAAGVFATSASDAKENSAAGIQTDVQNQGKTTDEKHAAGSEHREITNISLNLDNGQAEILYDEICKHMSDKYRGFYSFDNYQMRFCNETLHGDVLSLDIDVSADMTLIRNPKKSLYVKGMQEAVKEINNKKKKKEAEKIYNDYLNEVMSYYMQPEGTGFSYLVQIPVSAFDEGTSDFKYELFYRSNVDGEILGTFAEEPNFTDMWNEEDGKAYIKENL